MSIPLGLNVHTHRSEGPHSFHNITADALEVESVSTRHADNRTSNIVSSWPGVGLGS